MRATSNFLMLGAMLLASACGPTTSATSDNTLPADARIYTRSSAIEPGLNDNTFSAFIGSDSALSAGL